MKPRIALFGLPPKSIGKLKVVVYASSNVTNLGSQIYQTSNDESGMILDYVCNDIYFDYVVTIKIFSSGICPYSYALDYKGSDISHVAKFQKEENCPESDVSKDWQIDSWKKWNPQQEHERGLAKEKKCLMDRTISVAPIWESYFSDSNIDYLEKFQKLWIGLNSYATYRSKERGDKKKILSLVESDFRQAFNDTLNLGATQKSAVRWAELQKATGVNMTSNIVRDEIAITCPVLDFLEQAKFAVGLFSDISKELEGLIFLNNEEGKAVFRQVYTKYNYFMSSEVGITESFDLAEAFSEPRAPSSIKRFGRLIFHHPFLSSAHGNLFSLEDYFGSSYSTDPYIGQKTDNEIATWERTDPLFFRFLHALYKFRCAYFHGDISPNKQNNELARTAYQSLYSIFPAIL